MNQYHKLLPFCIFIAISCNHTKNSNNSNSYSEEPSNGIYSEEPSNEILYENECPINSQTTHIRYYHHTNSGIAIYTSFDIFENKIIWDYEEARNECHLRDSLFFPKADYPELIDNLTKVKFSVTNADKPHSSGGGGFHYSFADTSGYYLHYHDESELSGDYRNVSLIIGDFRKNHKTTGEIVFDSLAHCPHNRTTFGEFDVLPKELKKYKIK